MSSPQPSLTEYRLDQQGKALDSTTAAVAEMKVELASQGAKLDNLSSDLGKITKLMYAVLGAFAVSMATAVSKLIFKSGSVGL